MVETAIICRIDSSLKHKFRNAQFRNAQFRNAQFRNAQFRNAQLM
ncbi:pentapeptide repeat-containing protein [Cyanobacteria bacterium FACHB-DQ100]|nr:pentapeptide repeat-containing protein [Cyanobacteria bacterium FACHB-DQ100]